MCQEKFFAGRILKFKEVGSDGQHWVLAFVKRQRDEGFRGYQSLALNFDVRKQPPKIFRI